MTADATPFRRRRLPAVVAALAVMLAAGGCQSNAMTRTWDGWFGADPPAKTAKPATPTATPQTRSASAVPPTLTPVSSAPSATQAATPAAAGPDLENTLYIDLERGRVVIAMRPDLAPRHVARIKELARKGFYDGIVFHRVIPGFMAQTGDPKGTGTGGSGMKLKAEFSAEPHVRGTVSMARSNDPDSADSQFFICFAAAPHLNRQYTVWGKVVEGMELVDAIKPGQGRGGQVTDPDRMVRVRVAADARGEAPVSR